MSRVLWFEEGKDIPIDTRLLDESCNGKVRTGRMVVYKHEITSEEIKDLSVFFWSPDENKQDITMCSFAKSTPLESELIFPVDSLREMLMFETDKIPVRLYGLSAILANIAEKHSDKLVRLDNKEDLAHIDYLLDTGRGFMIKIRFTTVSLDRSLTIMDIVGLTVFKTIKIGDDIKRGPKIVRLNIIKAQHQIVDDLLTLPEGFTCHQTGLNRSVRHTRSLASERNHDGSFLGYDQDEDMYLPSKYGHRQNGTVSAARQSCACSGTCTCSGSCSCSGNAQC